MRIKYFKPQTWNEDWDLSTRGWAGGHTYKAWSCTGRCQSRALKRAAPGLHWGCMGALWGLYGGWRVPMVQMEPGMGQWGREGGVESQKAVKLEDETKNAMRMCPGPQSGSRTAGRPVRTKSAAAARPEDIPQLVGCSVRDRSRD